MCGRFTITSPGVVLRDLFGLAETPEVEPRYNVAPTQPVPVVGQREAGAPRTLRLLRWGLIPTWAKDASIGSRLINARAESVDSKPAFADSFRRHRCLIPADGFFEWTAVEGGEKAGRARRQPHLIRLRGGGNRQASPFAMAGLWASWKDPASGLRIASCSIITVPANELVAPIHDRMPAILPPASWPVWLAPDIGDPALLQPLLEPFDAQAMEAVPVGMAVNQVANDGPECVAPLALQR